MTRLERGPSIRRRLLGLLLLPVAVVLLAGTLSDYLASIEPVREAYDRALLDAAVAIAAHVRTDAFGRVGVDLPPAAIALLRTDALDAIYFSVRSADGRLLAGDADLPAPAPGATGTAQATAQYRGQPIRLVSYRSDRGAGAATITVAETTRKREHIRAQLLSTVLGGDLLELLTILGLVWLAVRYALQPLAALRAQIAQRSARDLDALAPGPVPVEVRALVDSLNRLFARIDGSSRAQRLFLENAAHQLRTPLTGVQAQLELLVAETESASARARLARTLDATRRLAHTTQQLLALAQSEHAASAGTAVEVFDLAVVLEAVVPEHLRRAAAAGLELGAELAPAPVLGSAWLIAEAVGNLLDNAISYTPRGGAVTVRCGCKDSAAFLEVLDTGIGIEVEERELVTTRFYRGRSARGEGSGLGLAIVAEVARLHDARLTILPGMDGAGTCVRFDLAAFTERPSPGAASAAHA
jgi:two-component system, OmpR family, sensor histidine kinase TctE